MINGELIVDNFAGGGGASTGIELATGKSVDIAINHDPEAIKMHKANHPHAKHYCENVWEVDPVKACNGHPVGLAWFSPDCKHFSKAKGGKPVEKNIRGLAWVVLKWAALVHPRVIMLENVEEFQTWGPCIPTRDRKTGRVMVNMAGSHGRKKNEPRTRVAEPGEVVPVDRQIFQPDPKRKGQTYKKWRKQLEALGYEIDTKELVAADYGAPTMRKRFFMIARCDGKPIVWPEPTHAPRNSEEVKAGILKPYVGAYTQIDFSLPCPSIFDTAEEIKEKYGIRAVRPLAPKTMERIARGLKKFVIDNAEPFIVQVNHSGAKGDYCNSMDEPLKVITSKHGFGIVEPKIVPYMGTNTTNHPGGGCEDPIHTITTGNQQCLISPTLIQHHSETSKSETRGQAVEDPIMTLDGSNRYGLVTSFLHKYYDGGYKGAGDTVENPLPTVTSRDHNSLVTVNLIQMNNHCDGRDITEPLPTITAGDGHFGEVRAFLIKYYGERTAEDIKEPLDTITSRDRFGLVTIAGVDYQIVDIGLRMLEPKELYGCQGFPDDYIIDQDYTGKKYPRSEQVRRCGNAVCPPIPAALVRSNLPELCVAERMPNLSMESITEVKGQLKFA
ncbi:MAG: DNA cytosine methyltransferase [Lachnospiraceae bacterium]|nr:DNA cytosine methyltransferase [Lachnospiraceae bacterium]